MFTDEEDEFFEKSGLKFMKTNCENLHSRSALCCKMSYEFDSFLKSLKKWWCHADDDTYLNINLLVKLLSKYDPSMDWYIGRPSTSQPLTVVDKNDVEIFNSKLICNLIEHFHLNQKELNFWFATGGAGFCISRGLALKMNPFAGLVFLKFQ